MKSKLSGNGTKLNCLKSKLVRISDIYCVYKSWAIGARVGHNFSRNWPLSPTTSKNDKKIKAKRGQGDRRPIFTPFEHAQGHNFSMWKLLTHHQMAQKVWRNVECHKFQKLDEIFPFWELCPLLRSEYFFEFHRVCFRPKLKKIQINVRNRICPKSSQKSKAFLSNKTL